MIHAVFVTKQAKDETKGETYLPAKERFKKEYTQEVTHTRTTKLARPTAEEPDKVEFRIDGQEYHCIVPDDHPLDGAVYAAKWDGKSDKLEVLVGDPSTLQHGFLGWPTE